MSLIIAVMVVIVLVFAKFAFLQEKHKCLAIAIRREYYFI